MTTKIYGLGWVGKAMKTLFPESLVHDPQQGLFSEEKCDVAFICVPTPLKDGKLDTSIVESVIKNCEEDLIICRSTVMPGTCDKLEKLGKNIVFQPEYLGETVNHPMTDQKARPFLILGGKPENRRKVIELYQKCYNANITIRQVSNYEAEIIKMTENRAIAFKVAQCQELYDVCQAAGVDYYTIRDAVYGDDPRFNLWFTFIFPEARGFNSKCIPKDIYGWASWAESVGCIPELTKKLLEVNDKLICQNLVS
jgi:UDPglucose 6-dehydrogenase